MAPDGVTEVEPDVVVEEPVEPGAVPEGAPVVVPGEVVVEETIVVEVV